MLVTIPNVEMIPKLRRGDYNWVQPLEYAPHAKKEVVSKKLKHHNPQAKTPNNEMLTKDQ